MRSVSDKAFLNRVMAGTIGLFLAVSNCGCAADRAVDPGETTGKTVTEDNDKELSENTGTEQEQTIEDAADSEEKVYENTEATEVSVYEKIDDNGKPIYDFDEFVNGEWKKEQAEKGYNIVYPYDDAAEELWSGVVDILTETDPESLSDDDGLKKILTVRNELSDNTDYEERVETMKAYLSKIEEVQSIDDLYDLYRDERYAIINDILKFSVRADDGYYVVLDLAPTYPWKENGLAPTESEEGVLFYMVMEDLGYSKDSIQSIASNTLKVAGKIDDFLELSNARETIYYNTKKRLEEEGVSVPVIDILGDQYEGFCPEGFNRKLDGFFATRDCYDFLNEMYVDENLQMIKDFHLACAAYYIGTAADLSVYDRLYGARPDQLSTSLMLKWAEEFLVQEYFKRNVDDDTIARCEALMDQIKLSSRSIIDDAQWLSVHGKEQAKSKVLRLRTFYGGDTAVNDFSDLTLTGNTVEDFISLRVSDDHYMKSRTAETQDERKIFGYDDYQINAHYDAYYNSIVFTAGFICFYQETGDVSEEENLGFMGCTMAHELGHAYDPNGSDYTSKGEYNPWMSDEEKAIYSEKTQKIADFFDGRKTEYGKEIDGKLVMNETYADLMAVESCLRILAEKEDPDYDAFFRSYAQNRAAYYTEEGVEEMIKDPHLPAKERINLVLGQFEKFYEIYDIDESSPYYVKAEDRLSTF